MIVTMKLVVLWLFLCYLPQDLYSLSPLKTTSNNCPKNFQHLSRSNGLRSLSPTSTTSRLFLSSPYDDEGFREQAQEAVRSLCDYHIGKWKGRTFSFSVTPDVAAGVIQRRQSPTDYTVSINFGPNDDEPSEFALTETYSWDDKAMVRSLPLQRCRFDVDAVDASYSLDERRKRISGDSENETNKNMLPSIVSGIVDNKSTSSSSPMCQLVVEHCIASGEDQRMRCFALYGSDGSSDPGAENNLSLIRVVVGSEERVSDDEIGFSDSSTSNTITLDPKNQGQSQQGLTAADLLEMQSDVDRLVDRISANIQGNSSSSTPPSSPTTPSQPSQMDRLTESLSNTQEGSQQLTPHDISLLEISSGVWLGDAVVRSLDDVPMSATPPGKGFGSSKPIQPSQGNKVSKNDEQQGFANWAVGVQKLAVRWMWNFGDDMRQIVDAGKALGSPLGQPLLSSLAGGVYVDESLSRRVSKSERMVYIGYPTIDSVGFLVGCYSVNVPRYVTMKNDDDDDSATSSGGRSQKPFYTEFSVFQEACNSSDDIPSNPSNKLADLVCSKSQRLYNFEGELKQGITSFYTFSRFGGDSEETDDDDDINDLLNDDESFL